MKKDLAIKNEEINCYLSDITDKNKLIEQLTNSERALKVEFASKLTKNQGRDLIKKFQNLF